MTDLNTQMTPEAMMQAEIEKSARDYNALRDAFDRTVCKLNDAIARAEKAERELVDMRAQTDALVAAAYDHIRSNIVAQKAIYTREAIRCSPVHALASNLASVAGTRLIHQIEDEIHASTPAAAKAALEARDRAMRNEGRRQAADYLVRMSGGGLAFRKFAEDILSLIEKEPEGKGDE